MDGAAVFHVGNHRDVSQRHAAIGHEAQHAAGLGAAAALVGTGGVAPPIAGIAGDFDAGVLLGEGHTLDHVGGAVAPLTHPGM